MCKKILFFLLVLVCSYSLSYGLTRLSRVKCSSLRLQNGRVKYRQKGRFAMFQCNNGFILVGEKYNYCSKGVWDSAMPLCVRPTCKKINMPAKGFMSVEHEGALIKFYCFPGYDLRGSALTYCDGTRWSSNLPTCVASSQEPETSCDFESEDLCGWTHDLNHDFDWRRQNFETPSGHIGTGPSSDHTKGPGKNGYYVYIESSSRLENDTARLISPVYSKLVNGLCFKFYYHMYGSSIGQLKVYVKKVNDTSDTKNLTPLFSKSGNQGNQWYRGTATVPSITQPFQIIIEGVRGSSYVSDIAVDDVSLLTYDSCPDDTDSSTVTDVTESDSTVTSLYDSCENRCFETRNTTYTCDCDDSCFDNSTCCPDYEVFCIQDATDFYTESTPYETETTTITNVSVTENTSLVTEETEKSFGNTTSTFSLSVPVTTEVTKLVKVTEVVPKVTQIEPKVTKTGHNITQLVSKINQTLLQVTQIVSKVTQTAPKVTRITQKVTRAPQIIPKIIPKIIKPVPIQNVTKYIPKYVPKINKTIPVKPVIVQQITEAPRKNVVIKKITKKAPLIMPTIKVSTFTTIKPKKAIIPKKEDKKSNNDVIKTVLPVVQTTILPVDLTQATLEVETDFLGTEKAEIMYQKESQMLQDSTTMHSNVTLIIGVASSLVFVMLAVLVAIFVARRYKFRIFGGFKNYKGSGRSDSFSDVRFLASDEMLDFTLRTSD